jgi:hypothetical protein
MSTRANFQSSYLTRYAIMAAICIGAGLWFAYDGFIGYPANLPAAKAYDEIRDLNDAELRIEKWKELAEQNNWSKRPPEKSAEEIENDIVGQYFWMTLCFLAGIPAVYYYLSSKGNWVESTETGLTTSWGQTVDFSKVTELNKKRWEKKGIAKATYQTDSGNRMFVFDDFKYEREPLGEILKSLEAKLDREAIVGGPTEAEIEARKKIENEAAKNTSGTETADSE